MSRVGVVALTGFLIALAGHSPARAEHTPAGPQGKLVLGWLETIVLKPWDVVLRAKLDTGANTASIDAQDIEFFEQDQQTWVRFTIVKNKRNDKPDHQIVIERPMVRSVLIREHFWESQERPVVALQFCLNGTMFEAEFNLVNRSNFKYPVLLGRRFLQNVALVDAEATLLTHTILRDCKSREVIVDAKDELGNIRKKPRKPSSAARQKDRKAPSSSKLTAAASRAGAVLDSDAAEAADVVPQAEEDKVADKVADKGAKVAAPMDTGIKPESPERSDGAASDALEETAKTLTLSEEVAENTEESAGGDHRASIPSGNGIVDGEQAAFTRAEKQVSSTETSQDNGESERKEAAVPEVTMEDNGQSITVGDDGPEKPSKSAAKGDDSKPVERSEEEGGDATPQVVAETELSDRSEIVRNESSAVRDGPSGKARRASK